MNSKKRNLLITLVDLHFGGISNLTLQTAPGLNEKFNVIVIYFGPNEQMKERFENSGITLVRITYNGGKDIFKAVKGLRSFIKENKIDIVSTNFTPDKLIVSLTRILIKFKVVGNIHNSLDPNITPINLRTWRSRFEEFFHNRIADKVVGVSECAIENAKKYRNLRNDNLAVIHSGIIGLKNNVANRQKNKKTVFVTACRFIKIKGLERLINIFAHVNNSNTNWELWLIGNGDMENSLKDKVDFLNLEDKIIFKGYQKDLVPFYELSDYYINSSYNEALGISILEAMSLGLPILGSDVGGVPEVVKDGYNGYLLDFNDEVECSRLISEAIDLDSEEYNKMAVSSLEIFRKKFSIQNYVDRIIFEYNELLPL